MMLFGTTPAIEFRAAAGLTRYAGVRLRGSSEYPPECRVNTSPQVPVPTERGHSGPSGKDKPHLY